MKNHLNHGFFIKRMERILPVWVIVGLALSACSGAAAPIKNPPSTIENLTEPAADAVPLRIAPQICENAAEPGISPEGLPYRPYNVSFIQGGTVEDGDFLFDLWVSCYPMLESNSKAPTPEPLLTIVKGLGVYGGWYYGGPKVEGLTQDYWGMEPDVLRVSGVDGPLSEASTSYYSGINMTREELVEFVESGEPFRFQIRIESPVGVHGAVLEFNLEPSLEGYIPMNITVAPWGK